MILTACLLSLGFCFAAPDSSRTAGELDDSYNLGRIVDNALMNASILYVRGGEALLFNGVHLQTGSNGVFNVGQTVCGGVGIGSGAGVIALLPELDCSAALGPSNRIRCIVLPTNFFAVVSEGGGGTGFDEPFYMVNGYQWDFLSKQGKIVLQPDQLENAFYFKPLVNKGQVRITANMIHSIGDTGYRRPQLLNVHPAAALGIFDNLQFSASFLLKRYNRGTYKIYGDDPYSAPKNFIIDTVTALGEIDFRTHSVTAGCGYGFSKYSFGPMRTRGQTLFASATHLLGDRGISIAKVRGNWDGYFTPLLGARQVVTQARLEYERLDESSPIYAARTVSFKNGIHCGLLRYCTIGERLSLNFGPTEKPSTISLETVFMNVPVREKGPSEVSSFEYLYGYRLKKGQVRAEYALRFPIHKEIAYYYETPSLFEYISSETVLGLALTDRYLFDPDSGLGLMRSDPVGSRLKNNDFFLKVSAGVSEYIVLSNSFELRLDRYRNQTNYYQYQYPFESTEVVTNVLYADNFGISIVPTDRGVFTMTASLIGQTDKHVSGREKTDYLFSFLYQGAF